MTSALDLLSAAALSRSLSDEQQIPVDPSLYDSPSESAIQPDLQSIGIPPTDEPDGDQTEDEELGEVANVEYPRNHEPKLEARVAKEPTSSLPPPIQTSHKLPAFATFLPGPDSLKLIISASSNPPSLKALPPLPAFDATFPFLSSSFPALPPLPAVDAVPHRVPEDSGIIRCVCSFTSDDGFTIQCDGCNAWLHASCVSISPDEVPEEYLCGICDPLAATQRGVDSRKAEEGQRKRVQEEDGKERDGLKRRASIGVGAMERASSTPRPKQARRSLTTEENPGPPPSAAHDSAPMTPATGSILRDAIGRRRRVGKQPATPSAGPGPGRPRSAATLANAALNDMSNASVPHRINTSVRNVREMSEEEEESGDERYESWQYEYTPVDSNLWPERQLIERLEAVLVDLSSGDSVTTAAMKDLWDRQSAERSTLGLPRDSRLPHLYDLNPILLDSLPQSIPTAVRPLANVAFHLVPPAAAFYIPPTTKVSQCPYPRPTVHALYSTTAIAPNTFITEIRGQIESLDAYRARPLNQYSMLGVPKQGVRALPHPWSLVVDSRNFGNEARFARSGCHPNAVIKAIRLTSSGREENALGEESQWGEQRNVGDVGLGVVFAIYSLVEIGRKEEIVLPWDWDDGHIVHALPSLLDTPPPPPGVEGPDLEPLSRKMSAVTTTILGTTSCACERKRDCALFWMCRAASAATSVGRGGSSKREPFSTLLLNALSGSRDEEKGGRGKTKVKKSDVGILLGLERGWIKESAKAIGAVEELVAMEVDELVPSHLDFDIVTSPLTPLTSPKKSRRRDNDQDVDSDSSDLTEPLPHQSDSESPRKKVRQIAPVEDDEEEEEEIVRPPPRRKLATKKPSSKDVGPARKKLKEREIEAERKLKRRKGESEEKVKLKTKTKTKVVIREREKDPKEMAMLAREKEVRDRFKEKSEVTNESDHGVDGRKRSSTFSTGSRPTKIDLPFAKLRQSRSPSPLIPPTAPARIETSSSFDFSGSSFKPNMTAPRPASPLPEVVTEMLPPPVVVLPPPPPPPPRARLSLAEYRARQAQKTADAPPPEPILTVRTQSPTSTLPDVASTLQTDSHPSPLPTPPVPSAIDTDAALKSIGAYFAREQAAGSGSGTTPFVRPTASPAPSTPASSSSSTPYARRESRFSQPHTTTPATDNGSTSALGLDIESTAAPGRQYGRQPAVYTGSSYSTTNEPLANPPIANVPLRSRTGVPDYSPPAMNPTVSPISRSHSLNIPAPSVDPRLARISPATFDAALPTGPRALPPSPPGPRAVYGHGRAPPSANATPYSERQSPGTAPAGSPSPYAAPYLSLAGDSQAPTPSAPRGFDSRTGANAAMPFSSNRASGGNESGSTTTPAATGARSNQWAPPSSSSVSSFRNAASRGGRFDAPSTPHVPVTPSTSARYVGIPRGPAAMGGAPPSGPRQLANNEQGGGGRGGMGGPGGRGGMRGGGRGGSFPGWGRGRGRGRGN